MPAPSFALTDRTALVTGAGGVIGRAIAEGLAASGAAVAVVDVTEDGARETVEAIEAEGGRAVAIGADVTDAASVADAVARTESELGALTDAVNCAGIAGGAPAEELSVEDWDQMIAINLTGVFLCAQAEARVMLPRERGAIVNIASMSGTISNKGLTQAHYNTSKAGVAHLTKALAAEWATRGIRVNSISPGYVETPMTTREEVTPEMRRMFEDDTPLGRLAVGSEIAGPAVFLLSDAASYCTGANLLVDGGFTVW